MFSMRSISEKTFWRHSLKVQLQILTKLKEPSKTCLVSDWRRPAIKSHDIYENSGLRVDN